MLTHHPGSGGRLGLGQGFGSSQRNNPPRPYAFVAIGTRFQPVIQPLPLPAFEMFAGSCP
jgi:hypothetical protein